MKKKRVYISGKMTGLPKRYYEDLFGKAEYKLKEMGMQPINPARLQLPEEWEIDHDTYLMMDLELLNTCDAIYMLANWETSIGAKAERDWAIRKYKEIMYEEDPEPEVDWSKVVVDTPIFVKNIENEEWVRRHFARFEGGKVYAWQNGKTAWSSVYERDVKEWNYAKLAE